MTPHGMNRVQNNAGMVRVKQTIRQSSFRQLQFVLKLAAIFTDTNTNRHVSHCSVDDVLTEVTPLFDQTLLQVVDVAVEWMTRPLHVSEETSEVTSLIYDTFIDLKLWSEFCLPLTKPLNCEFTKKFRAINSNVNIRPYVRHCFNKRWAFTTFTCSKLTFSKIMSTLKIFYISETVLYFSLKIAQFASIHNN